jgi:hypothetical protein
MAAPRTPEERAEQIRRIVDAAPPLTDAQRARLRPLLAGGIPARTPADDAPRMTAAQAARDAA